MGSDIRGSFRRHPWRFIVLGTVVVLALAGVGRGVYAALGSAPRSLDSINDIELQRGLVAHWKLDGTAKDNTPNGNNGTVTGAAATVDRTGKASGAYSFSGTGDFIAVPSASPLRPTTAMSVSVWAKPTNLSGTAEDKLYSNTFSSSGVSMAINGTTTDAGCPINNLCMFMYIGASYKVVKVAKTSVLTNDTWAHIVATYDGATMKLYVNGVVADSLSTTGSIVHSSTAEVCIGLEGVSEACSGGTQLFNGSIDDVRVYNRGITASEVTALSKSYDSSMRAAAGSDRLLGKWDLDGNTKDATPYGTAGTVTAATLTTDRKGRADSAYSFDGTSALIGFGAPAAMSQAHNTFTWSAWIYPTTVSKDQMFLSKQGANYFRLSGSELYASFRIGGIQRQFRANTTLLNNTWYHAAAVYDGSQIIIYRNGVPDGSLTGISGTLDFNSGSLEFGRWTSADPRYFVGKLDDVRIYGRNLSQAELKAQYDSYSSQVQVSDLQKGLVGDWPLNGNARDATPQGNNGTISGATAATDRKGRASSAYSFNGTSGRILTVPQSTAYKPTTAMSASWWVMPTNLASSSIQKMISWTEAGGFSALLTAAAADGACTANSFCVALNIGATPSVYRMLVIPKSTFTDNMWTHVAMTYDGTTYAMYINGSLSTSSTAWTGNVTQSTSPMCIGSEANATVCTGGQYFNGSMDDVRIWGRGLTAAEVQVLSQTYR